MNVTNNEASTTNHNRRRDLAVASLESALLGDFMPRVFTRIDTTTFGFVCLPDYRLATVAACCEGEGCVKNES
jgi:hypothetical protein